MMTEDPITIRIYTLYKQYYLGIFQVILETDFFEKKVYQFLFLEVIISVKGWQIL